MTANMLHKKLKTNESGRSMVEMLGVLAVIGVLSIAGIAGYTTAMNNYHANETVNQARLLATLVSTQRLLNANGGDLSDDDLKGKFTFDPAITDKIQLTATGLDPKVAARIKAMDLKIATVADGENGSLVFTFKNDMSTGTSSDSNTGGSGEGGEEPTVDCATTYPGTSTSGTGGAVPSAPSCKCPTGNRWDSTQEKCTDTCINNEGLPTGYYCKVGGSCSGSTYTVTAGDITPLPTTAELADLKIEKSQHTYYKGGGMTWDAAYYYCQALKARGDITSGLAGKDNTDLPNDGVYWVNSLDPSGSTPTSNNSCYAFGVFDGNVVGGAARDDISGYYALCE